MGLLSDDTFKLILIINNIIVEERINYLKEEEGIPKNINSVSLTPRRKRVCEWTYCRC